MILITRDKLNSRKLVVVLVTFASCCALLALSHLESADFATITLAIVGSYMAAQGYVDGKGN
jgi:uncharacterized MnhB-related membrane protein